MDTKFFKIVAIILISLTLASCTKSEKITYINGYPNLKGKHLVVYVASREDVGKVLLETFKEKTGCTYEYLRLPTEDAVSKIKKEKKNPKADLLIGGTCDAHEKIKLNDLTQKYISKNYEYIPEKYKDKDGYWTGFEFEPLSIVVNKEIWNKKFKPKGINLPKKLDDLLNPAFKGEIVMSDPKESGTAYTFLASVFQYMGEKKAKKYIYKLKDNIGCVTNTGFSPAQKVASGEYAIGINFLGDQLLMQKSGANILCTVPQNAGWNVDAVSKIKNCPDSKIADLFIDFLLSDEASKTLNNFSMGTSTRHKIPKSIPIFKNYNFYYAAKDRNKIINIWKQKKGE